MGVIDIGQPRRAEPSAVSALSGLFDLGCGCDGPMSGLGETRTRTVESGGAAPASECPAGQTKRWISATQWECTTPPVVGGGAYTIPGHTLSGEDSRLFQRAKVGPSPHCPVFSSACALQISRGQLPYKVSSTQQFYYNESTRTLRVTLNNPTIIKQIGGAVYDFTKGLAKTAACIGAEEVAKRAMQAAGCGDPPFASSKCRAAAAAQAAFLRTTGCGVPGEYEAGGGVGEAGSGGDWKKYLPLAAAGLLAVVILVRR